MVVRREDTALLRNDSSPAAASRQHLIERAVEAMGGSVLPALPAPPGPAGQANTSGAAPGAEPVAKGSGVPKGTPPLPPAAVLPRITLGRVKSGLVGVVWLVGGGLVLGYGATLVYANMARIEVDSAVIAGTVQPVKAPAAGVIVSAPLRPGSMFGPGDRIFTLQNPELEQSIALAEVRVAKAREDLRQREAERDAELHRRENYLVRARSEIARIAEHVNALTEVDRSARTRLDMMTKLYAQGNGTRIRLEEAAERAAEARSNLARERLRLTERQELLEALLAGHGHGASDVVVRLADAEAAVRRARAEVELEAQDLRVRLERRTEMTVRAVSNGQLLRALRYEGSHVLAGDTVAIAEHNDDRFIYAFLTQAEVGRVSIGDEAEVTLPAQRLAAKARVAAVERSGAYLDDVESRYRWNLSRDMGQRQTDRDRTARVTLRFDGADHEAAQRVLGPGTPAVVSFERRWSGGPLFSAFEPLAAARGAAQP